MSCPRGSSTVVSNRRRSFLMAVGRIGKAAAAAFRSVVIPFTDPVIVGRFVYHCHAADHEDKGMIGVVEVVA
jgi:FtsP/CotA-like multicopper oxidase with cupredoxin domain